MAERRTQQDNDWTVIGHERRDINVRFIIGMTALIVVLIVGSILVLDQYFDYVKERMYYEAVLQPTSKALEALRADEDAVLTTYQLIDTQKVIYQLPIHRAMELLVDEAQAERDAPR